MITDDGTWDGFVAGVYIRPAGRYTFNLGGSVVMGPQTTIAVAIQPKTAENFSLTLAGWQH